MNMSIVSYHTHVIQISQKSKFVILHISPFHKYEQGPVKNNHNIFIELSQTREKHLWDSFYEYFFKLI